MTGRKVIETKDLGEGRRGLRLEGFPPGAFLEAASPVDAMLMAIAALLSIEAARIPKLTGLDSATVSRCRHYVKLNTKIDRRYPIGPVTPIMLIKLHQFSGLPVNELLLIAGVEPEIYPYHTARAK